MEVARPVCPMLSMNATGVSRGATGWPPRVIVAMLGVYGLHGPTQAAGRTVIRQFAGSKQTSQQQPGASVTQQTDQLAGGQLHGGTGGGASTGYQMPPLLMTKSNDAMPPVGTWAMAPGPRLTRTIAAGGAATNVSGMVHAVKLVMVVAAHAHGTPARAVPVPVRNAMMATASIAARKRDR